VFERTAAGKPNFVNRFFRRMQQFGKSFSARRSQGEMAAKRPEVQDPRAKSSRHGKSTADKWNQ
jgi:hypothetical protein